MGLAIVEDKRLDEIFEKGTSCTCGMILGVSTVMEHFGIRDLHHVDLLSKALLVSGPFTFRVTLVTEQVL